MECKGCTCELFGQVVLAGLLSMSSNLRYILLVDKYLVIYQNCIFDQMYLNVYLIDMRRSHLSFFTQFAKVHW